MFRFLYKAILSVQLKGRVFYIQLTVSKTLFIIPTNAHYYKSVEMLKQFKSHNNCPDMLRFTQEPSSGSSPVLG
jgi:hypothetical protein